MSIFDSQFVNSIAAENEARAKAAEQARIASEAAARARAQAENELKRVIDQALREFPAAAEQIGVKPLRVSYIGGGPLFLTHHAKVWPVSIWYCIDKAGNAYMMEHRGGSEEWIRKAKTDGGFVKKVERQEAIDYIAAQAQANMKGSLEETARFMLSSYLRI